MGIDLRGNHHWRALSMTVQQLEVIRNEVLLEGGSRRVLECIDHLLDEKRTGRIEFAADDQSLRVIVEKMWA